ASGSVQHVVIAVGAGVVILVGQVQHVQLHGQVVVDLVGRHRVEAPVGRHVDAVGTTARSALVTAIGLADIVGAAAHGQLRQDLVSRPQAEAVLGRVGQFVAFVDVA